MSGSKTLSNDVKSLPTVLRDVLSSRGIAGLEALERYFSPSISLLEQPSGLGGVDSAAELILEAQGRIVVFGDYDCDGVCAATILTSVLRTLGKEVSPFIPDRLNEGYGMSEKSVGRMLNEHPDVGMVITVDNGINSVAEVEGLKKRAIAVVVTDHHLPGSELPAADALVNPKVSATGALGDLCGAAVAFMLANVLVRKARERGIYSGGNLGGPLLVLAGLATVTDLMPLTEQNRIIVSEALRRFRMCAPLGLRELYDRSVKTARKNFTSRDFGFVLGPRINASGRVSSGMEALELLLCDDREVARECARIVDGHNLDRKRIEQELVEQALSRVVEGAPAQVIDLPGGHPGVLGIIASRVLEQISSQKGSKAAAVCVVGDGRGSARASAGVNIREAMSFCSDCLERFGGHAAAGGFSVKPGMTDLFRDRLCEYCRGFAGAESSAAGLDRIVECWLDPADLTVELGEWVERMEPFGEGNPEPVFGLKNVEFAELRLMGQDGRHLSASFRDRSIPRAVWWGHGDKVEELRASSSGGFDLAFKLSLSEYGARHLELRIVEVAPHGNLL